MASFLPGLTSTILWVGQIFQNMDHLGARSRYILYIYIYTHKSTFKTINQAFEPCFTLRITISLSPQTSGWLWHLDLWECRGHAGRKCLRNLAARDLAAETSAGFRGSRPPNPLEYRQQLLEMLRNGPCSPEKKQLEQMESVQSIGGKV